jgi:hypothetical protein
MICREGLGPRLQVEEVRWNHEDSKSLDEVHEAKIKKR